MASASEIVKRYFTALSDHDLDAAVACWAPGATDHLVGQAELIAPEGIRAYFASLFEAFPDFRFQVTDTTTSRNRVALRWRASGTFAGPGTFQGFQPNGARFEISGCDVATVSDEKIQHNEGYVDSAALARQLGFLPQAGSPAEARLARLANLRTRLARRAQAAAPQRIAEGVWLVRGGFPQRTMNVYLIVEPGERAGSPGRVTIFDAGIRSMAPALRMAAARLGGIDRVVLGHADADHRGAAPTLGAPVYCHSAEAQAAQSTSSARPYHDFDKLNPWGRRLMPRLLSLWDGGPVEIAGTVAEGDEVAGFRVVELPGHAPGLIGLFRDSDRLALASDCVYTLDPQTGISGPPRVPHPAFNIDTEQARESIRKLASLGPAVAWFGHAKPLRGDVVGQLHRAAAS